MEHYTFLPEFTLRVPKNAFSTDISLEYVLDQMHEMSFQEAIYLASPSLHKSLMEFLAGDTSSKKHENNIIKSCTKYILRSRSRATPFGLFSSLGLIKWGTITNIEVQSDRKRSTKLDFSYLDKIFNQLKNHDGLKGRLKYYPNSTLYEVFGNLRYIEVNQDSIYEISSIEANEYILKVLECLKNGDTKDKVISLLESEEISNEDGNIFFEDLIDCQLIKSELEPTLTGLENLERCIQVLKKNSDLTELRPLLNQLKETKIELDKLDNSTSNEVKDYLAIKERFEFEPNNMFCTNSLLKCSKESTFSIKWQNRLLKALGILNEIKNESPPADLITFKNQFERRFGKSEVPLLHTLETLGYAQSLAVVDLPLIEGCEFNSIGAAKEENLNPNFMKLSNLLDDAIKEGKPIIELNDNDFKKAGKELNLSPSTSVAFRMFSKDTIYLEGVGGSSAKSLINRFSYDSEEINRYLQKITQYECEKNPDIILAEIIHLPENKLGNISIRKNFSSYEIPVLSWSGVEKNHQILLSDLVVFLANGQLYLKSKSLGKIVIPKLSTAHNYGQNSLYIYKFLCDMQFQEVDRSLTFHWGKDTQSYKFLPRLTYKGVILHLATWRLFTEEIKNLLTKNMFEQIQKALGFPDRFVIVEGDNELFIDITNPLLLELFKDSIKAKSRVTLKEFLLDDNLPIVNQKQKVMVNQFVAALVRDNIAYSICEPSKDSIIPQKIENCVFQKEEWVYLKLYCKTNAVDHILQCIQQDILIPSFHKKLIQKWFFIRYQDPDYHIRIRFQVTGIKKLELLFPILIQSISKLEKEGFVWKTEVEKYLPEIERYGRRGMAVAETIFWQDSERYISFLESTVVARLENDKWFFVLRLIHFYLESFKVPLAEKQRIMEGFKNEFAKEFGVDQISKRQLDSKYRTHRSVINDCLLNGNLQFEALLLSNEIVTIYDNKLTAEALSGIIHMTVNRFSTSHPRLHELFLYDFLYRHYTSEIARRNLLN
jgi:thiopeptide-type bacteriocin biosynthesis protein